MLFFQLFYTFLLIGAFTFGGGYSMIALIQNEVVVHHQWLTAAEFTDLLAVSQMTPGPVGGSLLASFSVIIIPVALMFLVGTWLLRHKDHPRVAAVMRTLRLAVIGLIAAAALSLLGRESFGSFGLNKQFIVSVLIFAAVFILSWRYKKSPILLIVASGLVGLLVYSIG